MDQYHSDIFDQQKNILDDITYALYIKKFWNFTELYCHWIHNDVVSICLKFLTLYLIHIQVEMNQCSKLFWSGDKAYAQILFNNEKLSNRPSPNLEWSPDCYIIVWCSQIPLISSTLANSISNHHVW